jgi:endoglycosylceramidase
LVRLCLNWNLLEPQPGNYSQQYLDRIAQVHSLRSSALRVFNALKLFTHSLYACALKVVGWAKEQGIYILLDMHQDQYSRFIFADQAFNYPPYLQPQDGQDGAPAWAVVTDGWPAVAIDGQGPLNLAVMAAVDNFYNNLVIPGLPQGDAPGPGLQDHFIGAIAFLAKRYRLFLF